MRDKPGLRKIDKTKEKKGKGFPVRKRFCRLCVEKVKAIDYKDVRRLETFIKERGKISSTRGTGNCARHQRMITEAIKRARYISLLPYVRA